MFFSVGQAPGNSCFRVLFPRETQDKSHVQLSWVPQSTFREENTEGRVIVISWSTTPLLKWGLFKMLLINIITVLWGLLWFSNILLAWFIQVLLQFWPEIRWFSLGFRISRADLFVLNTEYKRVNEFPELHILLQLEIFIFTSVFLQGDCCSINSLKAFLESSKWIIKHKFSMLLSNTFWSIKLHVYLHYFSNCWIWLQRAKEENWKAPEVQQEPQPESEPAAFPGTKHSYGCTGSLSQKVRNCSDFDDMWHE